MSPKDRAISYVLESLLVALLSFVISVILLKIFKLIKTTDSKDLLAIAFIDLFLTPIANVIMFGIGKKFFNKVFIISLNNENNDNKEDWVLVKAISKKHVLLVSLSGERLKIVPFTLIMNLTIKRIKLPKAKPCSINNNQSQPIDSDGG